MDMVRENEHGFHRLHGYKTYQMKKIILFMLAAIGVMPMQAQKEVKRGSCGDDINWSFNGSTLTLRATGKGKVGKMANYDIGQHRSPWGKRGLTIRRVVVEKGVGNIGSCAFAGCRELRHVEFQSQEDLSKIGWGAFLGCTALDDVSLPNGLKAIGAVAFARCTSLTDIFIPDRCVVEELAFAVCNKLRTMTCGPATKLEKPVFTCETGTGGQFKKGPWTGIVNGLPSYVSKTNCLEFGIDTVSVEHWFQSRRNADSADYHRPISDVDEEIPALEVDGYNTYAIIIGNQNYRNLTGLTNVPFALHDAYVFRSYLMKNVPEKNIRLHEDATKHEMEVEFTDWIDSIPSHKDKTLIVYYAGHGLPDDRTKAHLMPVDVQHARHGILLDDLYARLGNAGFGQVVVFLDACFSGAGRDQANAYIGGRGGVVIEPADARFGEGKVVVFAATNKKQQAQGYDVEQHGLFTYFLLRTLKDSKGDITFGELHNRISQQVTEMGQRQRFQEQTPTTIASAKFRDGWKTATFKLNNNN